MRRKKRGDARGDRRGARKPAEAGARIEAEGFKAGARGEMEDACPYTDAILRGERDAGWKAVRWYEGHRKGKAWLAEHVKKYSGYLKWWRRFVNS